MSSISSVNSSLNSSLSSSTQRSQRPDPSKMLDKLFSQLDTTGKGYLEKSDLQSALAQISGTTSTTSASSASSATSASSTASSSSASADEVFAKLDSNGDGKVTKDEMSSGMKQLAEELDSQFNQMRMSSGTPPPPPSNNAGFTKDELTSQLSDIGPTDSQRTDLISKIVSNFDEADTDENGKVSFTEAMAYDQQSSSSTSATSSTSSTSSSTSAAASSSNTTSSDLAIMKRIMELMQSYASSDTSSSNLLGTLSVTA